MNPTADRAFVPVGRVEQAPTRAKGGKDVLH